MFPFLNDFTQEDLNAISHLIGRFQKQISERNTDRNLHSTTFNFLPLMLDRLLDQGKPLNRETFKEAIQLSKEFAIEFESEFTK
jgi:hypothetical protein